MSHLVSTQFRTLEHTCENRVRNIFLERFQRLAYAVPLRMGTAAAETSGSKLQFVLRLIGSLLGSTSGRREDATAVGRNMAKNKERPTLRLKNGSDVDAESAYIRWQRLEGASPDQLKAFEALANGQGADVSMRTRAELMTRYSGWFADDGSLESVPKNVIQSAVRDSDEGKVVVTPFLLETQREVSLLNAIHRRLARMEADLLKEVSSELIDNKAMSSFGRQLARSMRRLAKEAKNSDDPGFSRSR